MQPGDYDAIEAGNRDVGRFPQDHDGADIWDKLPENCDEAQARDWLRRLKLKQAERTLTPCPRVFISHRQQDRIAALAAAVAASQCGFYYWLDILDPALKRLSALPASLATAIATAAVIEMALINCTHVIAVRTPNFKGSAWIPYEYGRVKTDTLYSQQAGCWNDPAVTDPFPEYFYLGEIANDIPTLKSWLQAERRLAGRRPECRPKPV